MKPGARSVPIFAGPAGEATVVGRLELLDGKVAAAVEENPAGWTFAPVVQAGPGGPHLLAVDLVPIPAEEATP